MWNPEGGEGGDKHTETSESIFLWKQPTADDEQWNAE